MTYCNIINAQKKAGRAIQEFGNLVDSYTGSDPSGSLTTIGLGWYNAVKNSLGNRISIEGLTKSLADVDKQQDFMKAYENAKLDWVLLRKNADSIDIAAYQMAQVWKSLNNDGLDITTWDAIIQKAVTEPRLDKKGKVVGGMFHYIDGGYIASLMKETLPADAYDAMINRLTKVSGREWTVTKLTSETGSALFENTKKIDRVVRSIASVGWVTLAPSNFLLAFQQGLSYAAPFATARGDREGAEFLVQLAGVARRATDYDNTGSGSSLGGKVNERVAKLEKELVSKIPGYDEGLTVGENLERLKGTSNYAAIGNIVVNSDAHKMIANVRNNYGDMVDFVGNRYFETEAMALVMQKNGVTDVEARLFKSLPASRQQQIMDLIKRDYDINLQGLTGAARSMSGAKAGKAFETMAMFTMYMGQYGFLNTKNLFRLGNNYLSALGNVMHGDFKAAKALFTDPLYASMLRQLVAEVNMSNKVQRARSDNEDEKLSWGQKVARTLDNAATVGRYLQSPSLFGFGRMVQGILGYESTEFSDEASKDTATYKLAKSIAWEFARQYQSLRVGDLKNLDFLKFMDGILSNKVSTRLRLTLPIEEETYGLVEDYLGGNYFNYLGGFEQPSTDSYHYKAVLEKWLEGKGRLQMMFHAWTLGWNKKYYFPGALDEWFQNTSNFAQDLMRQITEDGSFATVLRGESEGVRRSMTDVLYKYVIGDKTNALGKGSNEITYDADGNQVIEDNEESAVNLKLLQNLNDISQNAKLASLDANTPGGRARYLEVVTAFKYGNFNDGSKVYGSTKQKAAISQYAEVIAMLDNGLIDENYWPANFQLHQLMARVYDDKINKGEIAVYRNNDGTWTINEFEQGKKGYYSTDGTLIMKEKGNSLQKNVDVRKQFVAEMFGDTLMEIAPVSRPEMVMNFIALKSEENGFGEYITPKYTPKGDYEGYELTSQGNKINSYLRGVLNSTNSIVMDNGDPIEAVKGLNVAIREVAYVPAAKWETQQQTKDRLNKQAATTLQLQSFASDRIAEIQGSPDFKALALVKLLDSNMGVMDYMSDQYEAGQLSDEQRLFWEDYVGKHLFRWASLVDESIKLADIADKIGNTWWAVGWAGWAGGGGKGKKGKAAKVSIPEAQLIGLGKTMEGLQKRYANSHTGFQLPKLILQPIKIPDARKLFGQSYFTAVSNAITEQPTGGTRNAAKSRVFTIAESKPSKSLKTRIADRKKSTKKPK